MFGPRLYGESGGEGPRITLVNGFTHTRRTWGPFAAELARWHETLTVDAPGHGRSSHVRADLAQAAALVAATGGPGAYLGYSMGARICLKAALDHPATVTRLVLVSGSPGLADPVERAARRDADEVLAASISSVEEFVDRWLAQPIFASLPPARAERAARMESTVEGLAASLRLCGTGAHEPMWDRLGELSMPVLLLSGADDAKFATAAREMAVRIGPCATRVVLEDAGHALHLERPQEAASIVRAFLADGRGPGDRTS